MIFAWLFEALLVTTLSIIPDKEQSGRMQCVPTVDKSILTIASSNPSIIAHVSARARASRGGCNTPRLALRPSYDSLTVYVFLLDECVISQFYTPLLTEFYETYKDQKIGFIGYFPNFSSKPDQIESFGKKYKLAFPLKQDYHKDLAKKFGATVTPEVAVWDHRSERLIYRGRIDDSYVRVGKRKLHVQHSDLKDIIEDWLKGKIPEKMIETQAIGCFINFGDALSAPRSPKGENR